MTGSPEYYRERGLIPRTISYIFDRVKKESQNIFDISISYLEIYSNNGYDLLSEDHTNKALEDLPKVIPQQNEHGVNIFS
jgi:kinesin family member 6/9